MSVLRRSRPRAGLAAGSAVSLFAMALTTTPVLAAETADLATQAVTTADATALASAMASPSVSVTGARFQTQADPATAAVGDTPLTGFPTDGGTFAILSTGDVADIPSPGTFASTEFGSAFVRGNEAYDATILEVDLEVPTGGNCLAVDARFLTEDHWIVYGPDAFFVELDTSNWSTSVTDLPPFLPVLSAPNNFADAPDGLPSAGAPLTPRGWPGLVLNAENGAGTAFDGGMVDGNNFGVATDSLVVQTPITAGEHTVYFSIFDTGGDDSAVFLDNLRVAQVGNPTVDCAPGARALSHRVDLAPGAGSVQVGADHAVTATVTDATGAAAPAGTSVEFTVTGTHTANGTVATGAAGTSTFTWTGTTVGTDEVRACVRPTPGMPCSALDVATVTWTDGPPPPGAERVSGSDRYGTAAAISSAWAPGVDVVYLASGMNFPDAMPAGALGGAHDTPVLLTRADSLPDATKAELTRLAPQRIVVLGGETAVSAGVFAQLGAYALADSPDEVSRLSGPDRYETAAAAAQTYPTGVDVAYVASGATFPDAVTGASRAGAEGSPVLLTRPDRLPTSTAAALTHLNPGRIVVLGGTGAVHDSVLTDLRAFTQGTVTRLSGTDRYGTAAAIAGDHPAGVAAVFIASGAGYADSLAGAPLAASVGGPVLLTRPGSLPPATIAELERLNPARIVVLGGDGAVTEAVRTALAAYIG